MHDSTATAQEAAGRPARWLLFVHQIPPKPDYFRVKVRRRLQRIGAVALKNSVYVLPNTDDALEDLQWLRRMVVDEGGDATVCAAAFLDGLSDGEVESMFRAQSDAEYGDVIDAARAAAAEPTDGDVQRLARRLERAAARDFFDADRGADAERAVRAVAQSAGGRAESPPDPAASPSSPVPRGATWVTRAGVKVDRIASAWLIRRFIDPDARFAYVATADYRPASGSVRFDMFEGEYTHEGDACTFEVLVRRFALDDPALRAMAEIVHDVDCKDEKFGREEAAGVASLIRGIAAAHAGDPARVAAGSVLFDSLYAALARADS